MNLGSLAADVLSRVKARAEAARVPLSAEILPRLEEVTSLLTEVSVLRLAGEPEPELEQVLAARFSALTAAAGLEVADVVRDGARDALSHAIHGAFSVVIAAIAP